MFPLPTEVGSTFRIDVISRNVQMCNGWNTFVKIFPTQMSIFYISTGTCLLSLAFMAVLLANQETLTPT